MPENPYQPPSTPSNLMVSSGGEAGAQPTNSAYRVEDVLYCQPDFQSPRVCFKTGLNLVADVHPKLVPYGKQNTLELYFDTFYLRGLSKNKRFVVWGLLLCITAAICVSYLIGNPFPMIVVVALVCYWFKSSPPSSTMKIEQLPDGKLRLTGAHPHYLELFPEQEKL